jgi:uncharacterized SAM-binding protein YcdF (DUF218 family)
VAVTRALREGGGRSLRRAGRRTNLGVLLLLGAALLSGALLFLSGTPAAATAARLAHGVTGLGLLVLAPWKTVVVLRAARVHAASLVLLGLLLVCLVSGVVEVVGGYGRLLGISPIQVHVGSALAMIVVAALHVVRHRPVVVHRSDVSRRRLLATGGFALGMGATYGVAEGAARLSSAVAADRIATGSHRLAAAAIPATTWLFDRVPDLDRAGQRVLVAGTSLDWSDLDRLGRPVRARLDCTSGWYAEATWTGVPLDVLLDPAALAAAGSIEVTSTTGYRRRFPTSEAASLRLATRLEGQPLVAGQGAPVRLVAPGRRGFWWVKWVASVELSQLPPAAQSPFPLQ